MIKGNVKVCAEINSAASEKSGKGGVKYLAFGVGLLVNGRNGDVKDLDIAVTLDGDKGKLEELAVGQRVKLSGTLAVHKVDGVVKFYLRADTIELASSDDADSIEGTVTFYGKMGKKAIKEKLDKNGQPFLTFGAFSSDKGKETKMEFTWMGFLWFDADDRKAILQPGAYIEVSGDLQLGVYNGAIALDCCVSDVKPWVVSKR